MKINFTILFFLLGFSLSFAAKVDTLSVPSAAMGKSIKTVVITPEKGGKDMPVLYLLHGYSGDYGNWVNKVPALKALVDQYGYMVVCPDGGSGIN